MAIRSRGNKFEVDVKRIYEGKSIRKRVTCSSMQEAKATEAKLIAAILSGEEVEVSNKTIKTQKNLNDLFKVTFEKHYADSPNAFQKMSDGKEILSVLGDKEPITTLTTSNIESLISYYEDKNLKPSTIRTKLALVSKMITTAMKREWLEKKPIIDYSVASEKTSRFMTETEEKQLLSLLNKRDQQLVKCLLQLGCRIQELLSLTSADIEGDYVIFRERKNKETTYIPISPEVKAILDDGLFSDIDYPSFMQRWNKARKEMGLMNDPAFTPHICRHTFASRLLQKGVDLLIVSRLMGHTDIGITANTYGHLCHKGFKEATSLLW